MKINMDKSEIWNNPQGSTLKFSLTDISITTPKTANAKPRERERGRENGGVVVPTDAEAAGRDGVLFRNGGGALRRRSSPIAGKRGPTTRPGQGSKGLRQRPTQKAPR